MTETEQQTLPPSRQPADIAAGIAKDGQENLAGLEVVSVGSIFASDVGGELYLQLYIALPNRAGDDFVVHLITLAHVQDIPHASQSHGLDHGARNAFRPRPDLATSWHSPNTAKKNGPMSA
jgi:hypothetical protein